MATDFVSLENLASSPLFDGAQNMSCSKLVLQGIDIPSFIAATMDRSIKLHTPRSLVVKKYILNDSSMGHNAKNGNRTMALLSFSVETQCRSEVPTALSSSTLSTITDSNPSWKKNFSSSFPLFLHYCLLVHLNPTEFH